MCYGLFQFLEEFEASDTCNPTKRRSPASDSSLINGSLKRLLQSTTPIFWSTPIVEP